MRATSEQGSDAESNEKPVHRVTLDDYYIGETEVTVEQFAAFIDASGYSCQLKRCHGLLLMDF